MVRCSIGRPTTAIPSSWRCGSRTARTTEPSPTTSTGSTTRWRSTTVTISWEELSASFLDPNCGYYSTGDAEFKLRYESASPASGCGEASCVPVQGTYVSHFSGPGCTGTESYYLPVRRLRLLVPHLGRHRPVRHGPPHRHELLGEDQRRALPGPLAVGQHPLRVRHRLPLIAAAPQASSLSTERSPLPGAAFSKPPRARRAFR